MPGSKRSDSAAAGLAVPRCWSPERSQCWGSPILRHDIQSVVIGALLLGFAGATFDIVIDAYRIEILEPRQLGVGSGMSQYGWRLGAFFAASIALFVAARSSWTVGYLACMPLAFAGPIASLFMGEPKRHHDPKPVQRRSRRVSMRLGAARRLPQARGRIPGSAVRARPQDRRHDGEPDDPQIFWLGSASPRTKS